MKRVVKAVFIISLFTFLDRVLGFIFKAYLSYNLSAAEIGVYQVSLSFFFMFLSLITSGIPLVTSKITARYRLSGQLKKEASLSSAALICSLTLSLSLCLIILIFNRQIGSLFADSRSRPILLMFLPALLFSSVYSSLRGNLWGRQKYVLSSVLELVEQICRMLACGLLFFFGFNKLLGVALSLSIGCLISAIVCVIAYFASGARLSNPKGHFKMLIKSGAGVSAARASTTAINGLIAVLAPFLLMLSGLSKTEAMYEYGYAIGLALPLIYIPLTVVGSLSYVMTPSLSEASNKSKDLTGNLSVRRQIENAIKTSAVLGVLFFPLFYVLGEPIGKLVCDNADAGIFLSKYAWLLIPISLESITSSLLNPIDLEVRGLVNYLIGAASMLIIFAILFNRFSVDVLAFGLGIGWTISSILNILLIKKRVKISLSFVFTLVLGLVLAIPSVLITKWTYNILPQMHPFFQIAIAGGIGLVFMIVLDFIFGLLKIEHFFSKKKRKVVAK